MTEKTKEELEDRYYYKLATWIICNMFTDIDQMARMLSHGYRYKANFWNDLKKKKEDIKYTRMKFGNNSPLVGLWADCAGVDEEMARFKIIDFAIKYPNVNALQFKG